MSMFARSFRATARIPRSFAAQTARRTYAEAVPADKIRLSLNLPHTSLYNATDVVQVNLPATAGDMGVLANHVPTIQQLKPGVVEVMDGGNETKSFFVSGGFATVNPGSELIVSAIEAFPLEDFSAEAIRANLAEAQKIASGSGSEEDIAEANIQIEVLEALQHHIK